MALEVALWNTLWLSTDGIAFGEAVESFQTPPSRNQMRDGVSCHRLNESAFGGWVDEKIETAREAAPLFSPQETHPQHFGISRSETNY